MFNFLPCMLSFVFSPVNTTHEAPWESALYKFNHYYYYCNHPLNIQLLLLVLLLVMTESVVK